MDGETETTFAPSADMTRADMIVALYRMAGSPEVTGENPFTDVAADADYYAAVIWGTSNGVINGTSETTFSPDDSLQRQAFATMLYRYAELMAADETTDETAPAEEVPAEGETTDETTPAEGETADETVPAEELTPAEEVPAEVRPPTRPLPPTTLPPLTRPLPPTTLPLLTRPLPPTTLPPLTRPLPPTTLPLLTRPLPPTTRLLLTRLSLPRS